MIYRLRKTDKVFVLREKPARASFLTVYSFLSRTLEINSNLNMAENGGVEGMVVFQHLFYKVS